RWALSRAAARNGGPARRARPAGRGCRGAGRRCVSRRERPAGRPLGCDRRAQGRRARAAGHGPLAAVLVRSLTGMSDSLVDLLDRIVDTGVAAAGDVSISLADVELITLRLNLLLDSIGTEGAPPLTFPRRRPAVQPQRNVRL